MNLMDKIGEMGDMGFVGGIRSRVLYTLYLSNRNCVGKQVLQTARWELVKSYLSVIRLPSSILF